MIMQKYGRFLMKNNIPKKTRGVGSQENWCCYEAFKHECFGINYCALWAQRLVSSAAA